MAITQPVANELHEAYCELFSAVENGIDNDKFFALRERFRNIRQQVDENEREQVELSRYRDFAINSFNKDGELEINETAVVSHSVDGGAYVEAWLWVDDLSIGT